MPEDPDRYQKPRVACDFDPITPGTPLVVEQLIRPTGLFDRKITVRGLKNQIEEQSNYLDSGLRKASEVW